ncbi:hypothetical protein PG993_014850 [Apiospora rasikravindrae]|uniref:Uncharacterized protein n=1 Tax=Apiospora rasikravindrae TaxID=990691 RepID=A0ABR1RNX4_9PEZI
MPTATAYFGYTALNYGPLTTTFTADPSCATATEGRVVFRSDDLKYQIGPVGDCVTTTPTPYYFGCFPSASKDYSVFNSDVPVGVGVASYFSPGVACPSGWTTAGTMARATGAAGKPDAWNGTGSLNEDIWKPDYDDSLGRDIPLLEVYRQIMAPDETLALCCPSGYKNDEHGRRCFSSIAPLTSEKDWKVDVCYGGTYYWPSYETITTVISSTVTTRFDSIVTSPEPSETIVPYAATPLASAYKPSEIAEMVVVTVVAAVPLIHKASDVVQPNAAAASLAPAAGGVLAMVVPLATVVLSMFAGARMVLFR